MCGALHNTQKRRFYLRACDINDDARALTTTTTTTNNNNNKEEEEERLFIIRESLSYLHKKMEEEEEIILCTEANTSILPALVFDCDGTILETMTLFYEADKITCEERGLELSKTRFYELAGVPIKEIFRLLNGREISESDLETIRCSRFIETIIMHK